MAASTAPKSKKKTTSNAGRSTTKTWKRNKGEDLDLPSGNTALVKRPGPAALMSKGLLPDELTPIVQEAIRSGKGMKPEKQADLVSDPDKIAGMLEGMDKMLALVVVEPSVAFHKYQDSDVANPEVLGGKVTKEMVGKVIPEDERDPDKFIYTDEVDFEDKMFIFNYAVGGTRDHARFREELSAGVGDVQSGSASADQPE